MGNLLRRTYTEEEGASKYRDKQPKVKGGEGGEGQAAGCSRLYQKR